MAGQTASAAPEPWVTTLTERLKRARIAAGVSAEQMAAVLECTARTVRNYESGATPIKRKDVRDWAMRCGGARIHAWILTGEIPADGDNGGGGQVTDHSGWTARRAAHAARAPQRLRHAS